ncbi:MAG TPA: DNA primase [Bacteroidota bacterium]|nr:DNA primase [Bacteroidota bacterium]
MRIADEKIDEIRRASDIVDVISSYVSLKKRGKNYLGLCPFHQEKTPSFNVSPEKQMYHCFGCGVGGNVFTFIMEHDKVSFVEAVRTLAERAGIFLPQDGGGAQEGEHEGLYAACRVAGLHYHENLVKSVEGQLALEYFHFRGFSDATIRKFGLGYAKNSWDDLVTYAQEQKLDIAQFEKAGLVLKREDGQSYYDRFRGRATFPIFSASGRPIAFGARKMREDDPLGKYINSPETPIYVKSRSLYGLFQSKEAVRAAEMAILVEGYADLISVFQAGIENIVASSGTALTEEQIQLISRFAKTITIVYDADSAGSKAALRGVDLVIEGGLDVKVASLPEGDDPDSFVKKNGGDAFRKHLEAAVSFLDFKATAFRQQGLLASPEGKTRAVRSLVETIARMKDEIKRNFYVKSISEKYGIGESVLFRELEAILSRVAARPPLRARDVPARPSPQARPAEVPPVRLSAPERDLIKVMLEAGPPMIEFVLSRRTISDFAHPLARSAAELMSRLASAQEAPWSVPSIINQTEDESLRKFIADIVFSRYEISKIWTGLEEPDPYEIAESSILRAKALEIDRMIVENQREMRLAESEGRDLSQFREQNADLQKKKKELHLNRPSK